MRRVIASISLVIALLLIPLADKAQQPSTDSKPQSRAPAQPATPKQEPTQQSDQTIKTVVNLVDVLFTVLNRRNKLVPELEKGDFKIFDEGKPQEIRYFSRQTDLPLRIGMLMDTSNSIRERIKFEQDARRRRYRDLRRDLRCLRQRAEPPAAPAGRSAGHCAPRDDSYQRRRRQFIHAYALGSHRNGPAHQRGHLHHQHQHAMGFLVADRSEQIVRPQVSPDRWRQNSSGTCRGDRRPRLLPLSRGRLGPVVSGYRRRASQPVFRRLSSDELRTGRPLPQDPHRSARAQGLPGPRAPRLFRPRQRQRAGRSQSRWRRDHQMIGSPAGVNEGTSQLPPQRW